MTWKKQKPPSGIPAGGDGWGVGKPAVPFSAETQPSPEAKSAGHDVAQEVRDYIAKRRFEIIDRQIQNAVHGSEAASNQSGQYLINRLVGTPQQSVDMTSKGEAVKTVVVWEDDLD